MVGTRKATTSATAIAAASQPTDVFNVFLIGIDSVSRNNFHRQFKKTEKLLREELEAVELFG